MADKENQKRFLDLAERSYKNNQYTFTGFLSMAEASDFYEQLRLPRDHVLSLPPCGHSVSGGYKDAERVMLRFGSADELGYELPFPIKCILIKPLIKKFSDDLSHRDFLGALMNLGIERSELGDILIKDNSCYVFVTEKMSDFICHELTRVKHTSVDTAVTDAPDEIFAPSFKNITVQAKSQRIDSILAKTLNLSRNEAANLFPASKVFVNGRLFSNESGLLKDGDIISVRGYGKFLFAGAKGNTRKGNLVFEILKYI